MSDDYEVGYRKPPKHARFAKGESGNPKGRPNGSKNLVTDLREELAEKITVREGERTFKISKQRGILKSVVARALKGDSRATATLFGFVLRLVNPNEDVNQNDGALTSEERELWAGFEKRMTGGTPAAADGEAATADGAGAVEEIP